MRNKKNLLQVKFQFGFPEKNDRVHSCLNYFKARMAQKLPKTVIQAIEREDLSKDQVFYHDKQHGWVHQTHNDTFNNFLSKTNADDASTSSSSTALPLETLGPFGKFRVKNHYEENHVITLIFLGTKPTKISLTISNNVDVYHTQLDKNLNRLNISDVYGQRGPIAPVTLTGQARDVAHIPHDATHVCWIYPPAGFTQLTNEEKMGIEHEVCNGNLEYTFFALGGFAYFRSEKKSYKLLQTNCLVQADNGLVFQGPFQWNSAYTAHLEKQGRFQVHTTKREIFLL